MFQITVLVALKVYILYLKLGVVSVNAGSWLGRVAIQLIAILATFGHSHAFVLFLADQLQVKSNTPHGYLFSACIINCYFWKLHVISPLNEDGPDKMHCRRA